MSKHKQEAPITETNSLSDFLAESPIIQWISDNGRNLLWILLAFLASALLLYKIFGGSSTKTESDYFKAEGEFSVFENSADPKAQNEALSKLSALLTRYPDLQPKYDGLVAQTLLNRNEVKEALPFANRTLSRTGKDHLPFYADYAHATLSISQEKYDDALKQAQTLKEKMISHAKENGDEKEFGDALYLFNLLRIAMLNQQLGNKEEELRAWQEFKQSAVQRQGEGYFVQSDLFENVIKKLQEGKASLLNYIEAREKLLNQ